MGVTIVVRLSPNRAYRLRRIVTVTDLNGRLYAHELIAHRFQLSEPRRDGSSHGQWLVVKKAQNQFKPFCKSGRYARLVFFVAIREFQCYTSPLAKSSDAHLLEQRPQFRKRLAEGRI